MKLNRAGTAERLRRRLQRIVSAKSRTQQQRLPEFAASRRIADPVPFAVNALPAFLEYDAT